MPHPLSSFFPRELSTGAAAVRTSSPVQSECQRSLPVQLPVPPRQPGTAAGDLGRPRKLDTRLLPVAAWRPQSALQPHTQPTSAGSWLPDREEVWWLKRGPNKQPWIVSMPLHRGGVGPGGCEGKSGDKYLWWVGESMGWWHQLVLWAMREGTAKLIMQNLNISLMFSDLQSGILPHQAKLFRFSPLTNGTIFNVWKCLTNSELQYHFKFCKLFLWNPFSSKTVRITFFFFAIWTCFFLTWIKHNKQEKSKELEDITEVEVRMHLALMCFSSSREEGSYILHTNVTYHTVFNFTWSSPVSILNCLCEQMNG